MNTGYIKNVVVFCGSSRGNDEAIVMQSEKLGELMAQNGFDMIYGGGNMGIMGVVSDAAFKHGANVKGIIPKMFHKASTTPLPAGRSEHVVEDMLIRKDKMILEADAGIALPGGYGSLDEIFEMAVTQQLKAYATPEALIQPLLVINFEGYYDGQITSLDKMVEKGFLSAEHRNLIQFVDDAQGAIDFLKKCNSHAPIPAKDFSNFAL